MNQTADEIRVENTKLKLIGQEAVETEQQSTEQKKKIFECEARIDTLNKLLARLLEEETSLKARKSTSNFRGKQNEKEEYDWNVEPFIKGGKSLD